MMKIKKINIVIITLTVLINTVCLLLTIMNKYNSNVLVCLAMYIVIFIPIIIRKISKVKIADSIEMIFLIFVFLAQLLGSILHFYSLIYWYDSFTHFISGSLSALLALIILVWWKKYNHKDTSYNVLYMIAITLMIASLWEVFEFTCDSTLGYDAQRVLVTGVTDTMKDIICALLGSLLVVISYIYEQVNKKKLLINNFLDSIKK